MPIRRSLFVVALLFGAVLLMPAYARATGGLLWDGGTARALVTPQDAPVHTVSRNVPTLFAGRETHSLFAPYPVRQKSPIAAPLPGPRTSTALLLDLIASAEAGRDGYDAVVWAARVKPPKPPTDMTVAEIYQWIAATPNQHHAIGRYQFIPTTLKRLVRITGAGPDQPFTPAYQDRLAHILLQEAGLGQFQAREMGRVTFMNNLAKIWAGLPNASGRSHYHGIAGNRATMTWARFQSEMAVIYPL